MHVQNKAGCKVPVKVQDRVFVCAALQPPTVDKGRIIVIVDDGESQAIVSAALPTRKANGECSLSMKVRHHLLPQHRTSQLAHVSPRPPVQEQMAAADRFFQSGVRITATAFEVEDIAWPSTDPVPVVRLTVPLPSLLAPLGSPVSAAETAAVEAANCMCHAPGPLPPLVKTPRELLAEAEVYIACAPSEFAVCDDVISLQGTLRASPSAPLFASLCLCS